MTERDKMFFLLGGHDLEMLTIRDILTQENITYADRHLCWENAYLSKYQQDLIHIPDTYHVFGIELQEDIPLTTNYRRIDHHNQYMAFPSALEQVVKLLHLSMTRYWQLVAANDKAYIPGMVALGATKEEVDNIRKADRQAQGVEEKDEQLAEKAIAENLQNEGDLFMVYAYNSCFSPICDRLFPYRRLLIYTDHEWIYYGEGAWQILNLFEEDYRSGKLYYGGGLNGYVGSKKVQYTRNEILKMIKRIKR